MAPKHSLTYLLVAPCIPLPKGGHEAYTYHYETVDDRRVEDRITEGRIVKIPFGKRKIEGVVLQTNIRRPRYPTKPVDTVMPIVLTAFQIEYARYLSRIAHGGIGFTLRLFIP